MIVFRLISHLVLVIQKRTVHLQYLGYHSRAHPCGSEAGVTIIGARKGKVLSEHRLAIASREH